MISASINILTDADLQEIKDKAFQRGVERGKLEQIASQGKQMVALQCAHWDQGKCESCGVPWQYFEVDGLFKCPYFEQRKP